MTWKQWKAEVERQGVTDDTELGYVDVSTDYLPLAEFHTDGFGRKYANLSNGWTEGDADDPPDLADGFAPR
jgi:hypothetical protein